jgi:hypothetical protein
VVCELKVFISDAPVVGFFQCNAASRSDACGVCCFACGEDSTLTCFRQLIAGGRFELTVLTVFKQKARRITESLGQHRDAQRIPVHVVAVPELLPLITSTRERR